MDQYEYIEEIEDDIEDIIEVDEEDDIEYIEEVYKFNPNHGKDGRFATGNGNGLTGGGRSSNLQSSSNEVSATGANKFEKGFANKQKLNNHWQNGRTHKNEYVPDGIITKEQYEKRALDLVQSSCGKTIKGYKTADGQVCRYDTVKNDYVKGHPEKGIYTMFKPADGQKYFDKLMKKEGVEGDE